MEKYEEQLSKVFNIFYPEETIVNEKEAEKIANSMENAVGIAQMENNEGEHIWVILVSKEHDSDM